MGKFYYNNRKLQENQENHYEFLHKFYFHYRMNQEYQKRDKKFLISESIVQYSPNFQIETSLPDKHVPFLIKQ